MGTTSDLQVMQETLRGVMLALCASTSVDRVKLAAALSACATHPGIAAQSRLCLQDLAAGMTAIAPSGGQRQ